MSQKFSLRSLVLYKKAPAVISEMGEKISIQLTDGKSKKVRDKDIRLLHLGPINNLNELNNSPAGDIEAAWELLQDETVELAELAEFIYGENTPVTAWHAWVVLQEQLYFIGPIDKIVARTEAAVDKIVNERREKAQNAAAWQEYLQRVKSNTIQPDDLEALKDVERLAYGKVSKNRTMKELGIESTREKAHKLLLQLGLWNDTVNPYPARWECATTQPVVEVTVLPDEPREDLTDLETFAIDDDNCSDPDDAISLDGDTIWIHVADVAALITADSPLDLEARERGANLYLPEIVINMLPPAVTETLGLGLNEISPALSFKIGFNDDGSATCLKITPSLVKVQQISYRATEQLMDSAPFKEISAITDKFRERRLAHGAAEINLPEVKIKVSVTGELYNLAGQQELTLKSADEQSLQQYEITVSDLPRLKSRDMVTDAMLMAGEAVAEFLIKNDIPAPFASQSPPEEQLEPETMAEMFAYRKLFKRTELHLEPDLHAGLGLEHYTRVTSPLRRYSDLLVHQQLRAFISGQPLISADEMLERIAEAETGGRNTAMAERQSNRHWSLLQMQQYADKTYRGVVVDKRDDRGVILIPELGIDVKMRRIAALHLDDEVELKLNRIDLPELDFSCRIV
jgi:exoribonuclease II